MRIGILTFVLAAMVLGIVGCSTDENPISPDKMEQIRKQEGDQRANFKPSENAINPSNKK
jgi:hypothetical protein